MACGTLLKSSGLMWSLALDDGLAAKIISNSLAAGAPATFPSSFAKTTVYQAQFLHGR